MRSRCRRPFLVMTRSAAIPVLNSVLAAPVTRTLRNIPTELALGPDDGMPEECAATFDNLRVVPKAYLVERQCTLQRSGSWRRAGPTRRRGLLNPASCRSIYPPRISYSSSTPQEPRGTGHGSSARSAKIALISAVQEGDAWIKQFEVGPIRTHDGGVVPPTR